MDAALPDLLHKQLKALASPVRLRLLDWLKDPVAHFPPQVDGDLVTDGVCSVFVARKWEVTPASASRHLQMMTDAQLLIATRKKGWTFYRRDERTLATLRARLSDEL